MIEAPRCFPIPGLTKRILLGYMYRDKPIRSGKDIACLYRFLRNKPREETHLMLLSHNAGYICHLHIASGVENETPFDIEVIVKLALAHNAKQVVPIHNHPDGNPVPSSADLKLIYELQRALLKYDIRVYDDIIIGSKTFCSLHWAGLLPSPYHETDEIQQLRHQAMYRIMGTKDTALLQKILELGKK